MGNPMNKGYAITRKIYPWLTPKEASKIGEFSWKNYYMDYLYNLSLSRFEWVNLPDTIDERYLEMMLLTRGEIAIVNFQDNLYAIHGASNDGFNMYHNPKRLHTVIDGIEVDHPLNNQEITLVSSDRQIDSYKEKDKNKLGVMVYNNRTRTDSIRHIELFANELKEIKQVGRVNLNAQKTPRVFWSDEDSKRSLDIIEKEINGNAFSVFLKKGQVNLNDMGVFNTEAPYIVDKMDIHRENEWNEIMTFLGIYNANMSKRERLVSDEVNSNNHQIEVAQNVYLAPRKEACRQLNKLFGCNIDVVLRYDGINEEEKKMSQEIEKDNRGKDDERVNDND